MMLISRHLPNSLCVVVQRFLRHMLLLIYVFMSTARVLWHLQNADFKGQISLYGIFGTICTLIRWVLMGPQSCLSFALRLVVSINDCWLFLLHAEGLFEEVTCNNLDKIMHLVVSVDLFKLIQVIHHRMLGLVSFEDCWVGAEKNVQKFFGRNHFLELRGPGAVCVACKAEHVQLFERRDLGQTIVEGTLRRGELQRISKAEALWNFDCVCWKISQMAK